MKVTLKNDWFAPSDKFEIGKQQMQGTLYKRGTQNLPDKLRPYLPKTAVVHDEAQPVFVPAPKPRLAQTLRDLEEDRANSDAEAAVHAKLNKKG